MRSDRVVDQCGDKASPVLFLSWSCRDDIAAAGKRPEAEWISKVRSCLAANTVPAAAPTIVIELDRVGLVIILQVVLLSFLALDLVVLDNLRNQMATRLLDVLARLCTTLVGHEKLVVLHHLLNFFISDFGRLVLVHKVALVAQQQDRDWGTGRQEDFGINILLPVHSRLERSTVEDVEHNDCRNSVRVKYPGQAREPLLTSNVPELNVDISPIGLDPLQGEINTNCGLVVLGEGVANVAFDH
mmetsp:Transcript_14637/g.16342  ORF Transcript_14637/g.16342 Transcript_14637/m.16342 type:complete len:243 (+) Transcript_14637:134-862(+)